MVTLRSATPEDAPAVLELWATADAEPTHTDDIPSLVRLLEHAPGSLVLAIDGDAVIGSVIAGWDGWRGAIYRLVVAPTHRRRGLARRLLAEAERQLARLGAVRSAAIVVEGDDQAMGFWRASGWMEQDQRRRFVKG